MRVNNFGNTWAMRLIVFSKYRNFNEASENAIENPENVFSFQDKSIWTGSGKLSVLFREYS